MSTGCTDHEHTTSPVAPATALAAGPRRGTRRPGLPSAPTHSVRYVVPDDGVARLRADLTAVLRDLVAGNLAGGRIVVAPGPSSGITEAERGVAAVLPAVLAQQGLRRLVADADLLAEHRVGRGRAGLDAAGADGADGAGSDGAGTGPAVAAVPAGPAGTATGAGWDGWVHRRCRIEPVEAGARTRQAGPVTLRTGGVPRAEDPHGVEGTLDEGSVDVTCWIERSTTRAGWELLRLRSRVEATWLPGAAVLPEAGARGGERKGAACRAAYLVTDDLARRLGPISASNCADLGVQLCRSRRPRVPISASNCADLAREVSLTRQDVVRWAQASGDRNALHLVPGAAGRAGLAGGPGDVVAHGLMLAALSTALVPPDGAEDALEVRMPAPAVLSATGSVLLAVSPSTGDVVCGGRTVLRRV